MTYWSFNILPYKFHNTFHLFLFFHISDCGVRPIREGRIVGGRETAFGDWPWQVLVKESTLLGSRANQI